MARLFRLCIAAIAGVFVLVVCVCVLSFISTLFDARFGFGLIGFSPMVFLVLFFAVPLGCSLGMYLEDRRAYGPPTIPLWRILTAFLTSYMGIGLVFIILKNQWLGIVLRHYTGFIFTFCPPLAAMFFALIGYHLPSLFVRKVSMAQASAGEENNLYDKKQRISCEHRTVGKTFLGQILPLGILIVCVSLTFYLLVIPAGRESERAADFVKQCMVSINNDTDFYKNRSAQEAIQQIHSHRSMISGDYDITGERMPEFGQRYYYIVFDNTHKFEVFITGFQEFTLQGFYYDKTGYRSRGHSRVRND